MEMDKSMKPISRSDSMVLDNDQNDPELVKVKPQFVDLTADMLLDRSPFSPQNFHIDSRNFIEEDEEDRGRMQRMRDAWNSNPGKPVWEPPSYLKPSLAPTSGNFKQESIFYDSSAEPSSSFRSRSSQSRVSEDSEWEPQASTASRNSIFDEPGDSWMVKPAPKLSKQTLDDIKKAPTPTGWSQSLREYHDRIQTSPLDQDETTLKHSPQTESSWSDRPPSISIDKPTPKSDLFFSAAHSSYSPKVSSPIKVSLTEIPPMMEQALSTESITSTISIDPRTPWPIEASSLGPLAMSSMFNTISTEEGVLTPGMSMELAKATPGLKLSYLMQKRNLLGQGRYAQVFSGTYRIESLSDNPLACAVKRLRRDAESKRVGITEVCVLRWLHKNSLEYPELGQHAPGIVPLLAVDWQQEDIPRLGIVLPLAMGSLGDYVKSMTAKDDPTPIGKVLWRRWALELSGAVAFCHSRGVVHHDIKPQNVLLTEALDCLLSDFGNAAYVSCPPTVPTETIIRIALENPTKIFTKQDWMQFLPKPMEFESFEPQDGIIPPLLFDGLGRGTDAYSPPELWQLSRMESPLSATPVTPFAIQTPIGVYGYPVDVYSLALTLLFVIIGAEPFDPRPNVGSPRTMRRTSSVSGARLILAIKRGVWQGWVEREAMPKTLDTLKFLTNDTLVGSIVDILKSCLDRVPDNRPSAKELLNALEQV